MQLRQWSIPGMAWIITALLWPAAAVAEQGSRHCEEVSFLVSLDGVTPPSYRVAGELCRPEHVREGSLQILIHGSTYNRSYWDFPYQPHRYSYVRHANAAGFATLAIDRLGSGASDRPPGELVSVHATANGIHEIVTAMRSGELIDVTGRPIQFRHVLLVGHSFGSNIAWTEAGIYGDVDGIVVTAISHDQSPPGAPLTVSDAYPAAFDPAFASLGLPSSYLTTIPGKRGELFYYLPGADPQAIAVDEATKDTLPIGVLFDQFTTYELTRNIHVPVLNVVGDFDTLACQLPSCSVTGSIANEPSFYPADARYEQLIVPNAGHSINLHRDAPNWFARAQAWAAGVIDGNEHRRKCRHVH